MNENATLAEIVNDNHHAARVFERHHLDYCCGGRQTLQAASAAAGIDVGEIVAELAALVPSADADWATMGPADLADHVERTHHAYLHEELPRLDELAAKVARVHGERHPELGPMAALVTMIRVDLEPHLMKEERVLFPMIRELVTATHAVTFHCGSIENPIRMMGFEHDRTGELLAQLRAVTAGFEVPDDACTSYRALYKGLAELEADTHLHVHKENNLLFPAAIALEQQGTGSAT